MELKIKKKVARVVYDEVTLSCEGDIHEYVGAGIKTARNNIKMSQEELGRCVGLSRVAITNIEKGNNFTSLMKLAKICTTLKLKSSDLLPF